MKKILSIVYTAGFSLSLLLIPIFVGAQGSTGSMPPLQGGFENPLKVAGINTVSEFIHIVLTKIVIPIGAVVSVVFIIYAGFLYVMARGNPAAVTKAHQALINALLGTLIILGSWAISLAIKGTVEDLQNGL